MVISNSIAQVEVEMDIETCIKFESSINYCRLETFFFSNFSYRQLSSNQKEMQISKIPIKRN
jgi:hypothetical protein